MFPPWGGAHKIPLGITKEDVGIGLTGTQTTNALLTVRSGTEQVEYRKLLLKEYWGQFYVQRLKLPIPQASIIALRLARLRPSRIIWPPIRSNPGAIRLGKHVINFLNAICALNEYYLLNRGFLIGVMGLSSPEADGSSRVE